MYNKTYYVYLLTNRYNNVIYTGVTNNLNVRIYNHKLGLGSFFTSKYKVTKLVYYEVWPDIKAAISREKQIKAGSRKKKIALIDSNNPNWDDLYLEL